MSYRVVWRTRARNQLARLWLDAADRQEITSISHVIDVRLSLNPLSQGEGRVGTSRILMIEPLVVLFEVIEDDRRVIVEKIWRLR
jgi:hypothetical protein